jgi:hypothetical protein
MSREIPGQGGADNPDPGYSAQGPDNPALESIFLAIAAGTNLIDRGKEVIQHDSWEWKTTTRGPNHQDNAKR